MPQPATTSVLPSGAKSPHAERAVRVALIGNPNTGKTTLFNALTGHRARVGNYSGVTVEKREGRLRRAARPVTLLDLPGTYSLSAHSADELVAAEVLLGILPGEPAPDAAVVVADASNLERNLFLATQVMELGLPVVLALNMSDVARENGLKIDTAALSRALGVQVVELVARTGEGVPELARLLEAPEELKAPPAGFSVYTGEVLAVRERLAGQLREAGVPERWLEPFLVSRPLVEPQGMVERIAIEEGGEAAREAISGARGELEAGGQRLRSLEAASRYRWIREHAGPCIRESAPAGRTSLQVSDRIDAVLTHRVWGVAVFVVLMALVFQAIFSWSAPVMDLIEDGFSALGAAVGAMLPEGPLRSFIVNGVIAGVGGVLVFLPQICVLFLFIALLEDVGYMARAAFLMDRLLSRAGLSGRSFIPMLSSFACAIPGIMAARSIENTRDRFATIMIAPLMSCSARLPVYTLFIAAFIPSQRVLGIFNAQGLTLLAMYFVGVAVAIPTAFLLKKTLLRQKTPPFLIELPPYRRPMLVNVLFRVWERAREFLVRAGTIILAVSVIIWALSYYPRSDEVEASHGARVSRVLELHGIAPGQDAAVELDEALQEELSALEYERDGEHLRQSFLGRMGRAVEPVVMPLGWDWRIGMAAIASFPAREVIIATLGIIFDIGSETDEEDTRLVDRIQQATWPDGRPLFTFPVALGIMVFFALCLQCAATLAIMRQETNSWRWPIIAFVYMTVLAYIGALLTYQIASAILG